MPLSIFNRLMHLEMEGKERPLLTARGESLYATRAADMYDDERPDRSKPIYGLVVHTTGGGAPNAAARAGVDVLDWCVARYSRTYGCHYVNGYEGYDGELIQVGNEFKRPNTVGMSKQVASVRRGMWTKDISRKAFTYWKKQWGGQYDNPVALFPGTSANQVYVGVEMPPCVWWDTKLRKTVISAAPMRPGLRFTEKQHDMIVWLAADLAARHDWPYGWWHTPRLVGHEGLSPISRSNSKGCWDPGFLRPDPYFDFNYVRDEIATLIA